MTKIKGCIHFGKINGLVYLDGIIKCFILDSIDFFFLPFLKKYLF